MTDHDIGITYEFGRFSLDPRERRLFFDSEPVLLTPKAFETLALLVERHGHVITKDELMRLVWPDSFVEESGLTRNISVLRKELDRAPGGRDLIETVPKVGYRFNAEVIERTHRGEATLEEASETPVPGAAYLKPWSIFALIVAVAVSGGFIAYRYRVATVTLPSVDAGEMRRLAVLPFKSLAGEGEEDENLQVGIADALISKLSNVKQLTLKPTSAVRKYAGSGIGAQAAGLELGVDAVVEGSIQRSGERMIVSVQLVRAGDGASVWAQRFEDRADDVFAIQDVISERIVTALQLKLDADEQERLFRRYTQNTAAFDAYLRGRNLLSGYTRETTLAALLAFEEALGHDPNYALARDGMATASAEMFLRFANESESEAWARRADEEIAKALALDPTLAETHQALAAVYRKKDFDWERVLEESERALELNASLEQPHYYRAAAFYHLGVLDAALTETELAERINPQNRIDSLRTRGVVALYGGRFDDAIASFEEVQRLSSKPIADSHLALAYFYRGDAGRAEQLAAELTVNVSRSASTRGQASLASFLAARGARAESREILRKLEMRETVDHHTAYSIGCAYAQLQDKSKALHWLRRAVSTGLACFPLFEKDKLLVPLRDDAGFQALLNELRQVADDARARHLK
ncbi:MAG TPA: winged helix-turn-helix domain-containing protein [Pyrinomonadaceae bacterium]|nr:winged helix-turn-helix domain-containing protein [Pyrinomonadaceae bacterium]